MTISSENLLIQGLTSNSAAILVDFGCSCLSHYRKPRLDPAVIDSVFSVQMENIDREQEGHQTLFMKNNFRKDRLKLISLVQHNLSVLINHQSYDNLDPEPSLQCILTTILSIRLHKFRSMK